MRWWYVLWLALATACTNGEPRVVSSTPGDPSGVDPSGVDPSGVDPSCRFVVHRVDRDGDGHLVEDPAAPASCGDYGQPGYVPVSIGFDYDCDDSDPDAYAIVYRDADGDGHTALGETTCGTPETPGYNLKSGPDDCDDTDPAVHTLVYRDADGDGRVTRDDTLCATPDTPGYLDSTSRLDCDDSDPLKTTLVFPDLDHDGFGVLPGLCEPASIELVRMDGDCDDGDPSRHAYSIEVWDDGLDSDCDGEDNWSSCPLAEGAPVTIPIDPSCGGPDIVVATDSLCPLGCSGGADYTVRFGNRGVTAATGILRIEFQYSLPMAEPPYGFYFATSSLELDVSLEPGATTPAITFWEGGWLTYSIDNVASCTPGELSFSGPSPCRP